MHNIGNPGERMTGLLRPFSTRKHLARPFTTMSGGFSQAKVVIQHRVMSTRAETVETAVSWTPVLRAEDMRKGVFFQLS